MIDYSSAKKTLESKGFVINKKEQIGITKFKHYFQKQEILIEVFWEMGGAIINSSITKDNHKENISDISKFFLEL